MYEESIRVPGFIYDPRHTSENVRTSELVLNIDLATTILDYAGLAIPPHMDGKSLLPLLQDPELPFREEFFYERLYRHQEGYIHIERSEGLRTREWAYIHYINQKGPESEELYHLEDDPLQLNDLSDDPEQADLLSDFRKRKQVYAGKVD